MLSFTELDDAVKLIRKMTGDDYHTTRKREKHRQDPVRAAAAALTQLGWTLKDHRVIMNHKKQEFDLYFTSPAMLKHYIAKRMDVLRWAEADLWRRNYLGGPVWRDVVQPVLKNKKLTAKAKSMILCMINQTIPTSEWLKKHGWPEGAECQICGKEATWDHIMKGSCEENNPLEERIREDAWKAVRAQPPPPDNGRYWDGVKSFIDGDEFCCSDLKQVLVEGCEIYTDGSAVQVRFQSIAHAACAAVQWDKEGGFRVLKMQVPPEWPQTAVCEEFLAVIMVAKHLFLHNIKGATIVTDCQAVQSLFYNKDAMGYRVKFAGAWKGPELSSIECIKKCKAHLTKQEAELRGEGRWWKGNDRADACANDARAFTYNNKEWLAHFKEQSTIINRLANRLAAVLPTTLPDNNVEIRRAEAKAKAKAKGNKPKTIQRRGKPDQFETITVKKEGRWETVLWGARHQVAMKLAKVADPSHLLMQAEFFNPKKKEAKLSPLLYCSKCGVYATTRAVGLKDKCTPPKKGVQPKGKAKTQHYEQYRKCKPRAPESGDSDLDVQPEKKGSSG